MQFGSWDARVGLGKDTAMTSLQADAPAIRERIFVRSQLPADPRAQAVPYRLYRRTAGTPAPCANLKAECRTIQIRECRSSTSFQSLPGRGCRSRWKGREREAIAPLRRC